MFDEAGPTGLAVAILRGIMPQLVSALFDLAHIAEQRNRQSVPFLGE
jgi:hypothetical protein